MLVAEILNRDAPTVGPDDDVFFAVRRLQESRGGILPVVVGEARGARIVGVLRYRDVFTATYGRHDATTATPVGAAMSPAGFTCRSSDSLGLAVRLLRRSGNDALPVLDADGYLVGVLSFADLMKEVAK